MSQHKYPYIVHCGFCEQGMLRFARCEHCGAIVALCDECELIWSDIAAVRSAPSRPADGAFPRCPVCGEQSVQWTRLSADEVRGAELQDYMAGKSV
jgi:hypothetical protein